MLGGGTRADRDVKIEKMREAAPPALPHGDGGIERRHAALGDAHDPDAPGIDARIGPQKGEAGEGIAVIPSFGLAACRSRKVSMSELVEPIVTQEFYEISNRGARPPEEAGEFSGFLKKYIARWAGEAGIL